MSYQSSLRRRVAGHPAAEPKPSTRNETHRRSAKMPGAYTLTHAGRQFRIGPIAFWLSVSGLLVMALWSAGTATYFSFRDDLLTRLITRQAEMVSYVNTFWLMIALGLFCAPLILLLRQPRLRTRP